MATLLLLLYCLLPILLPGVMGGALLLLRDGWSVDRTDRWRDALPGVLAVVGLSALVGALPRWGSFTHVVTTACALTTNATALMMSGDLWRSRRSLALVIISGGIVPLLLLGGWLLRLGG